MAMVVAHQEVIDQQSTWGFFNGGESEESSENDVYRSFTFGGNVIRLDLDSSTFGYSSCGI